MNTIELLQNIKNWIIGKAESGELPVKLADDIRSWFERGELPVEDTFIDRIRTTAGDTSIRSEKGAKLLSIFAASDFESSALVTTGFNQLHHAQAVGTGYYFFVPALPFGTFGTAERPNGILFTNSANVNLRPNVRFKTLSQGGPSGVNDGIACPYVDSNGYRFYTTPEPGFMIVSDITFADTCAHIAWSQRYDDFISPTAETDAGSRIVLTPFLQAVHSNGYLYNVKGVGDGITFEGGKAYPTKRIGEVRPTWTTTPDEVSEGSEQTYTHTARISDMKINGVAECSGVTLAVEGTDVSYKDNLETATTNYVRYELATPAVTSMDADNEMNIEDLGLEYVESGEGQAYITMQYAQSYPDTLAAIAAVRMDAQLSVVAEALARLANDIKGVRELIGGNLGNVTADAISLNSLPKVNNSDIIKVGTTDPDFLPTFVGQTYKNVTTGEKWTAKDVTGSLGDWQKDTDTSKQDVIEDLAIIRAKANSAYQKPQAGIPDTDTEFTIVISEALTQLHRMLLGIQDSLKNLGDTKAVCIDFEKTPKVCGGDLNLEGEGAPTVLPQWVGQGYHDTLNNKKYEAFRVTGNITDWVLLN